MNVLIIERLRITFVFPANGKNPTFAVCRFYVKVSNFTFVVNLLIPLCLESCKSLKRNVQEVCKKTLKICSGTNTRRDYQPLFQ